MTHLPTNRQALITRINAGETFKYFFFWGHTPPKDGGTSKSCLSQWFPAKHWMMAEKARLFGDPEMLAEIIQAPGPKEAKASGRKVRNFDGDRGEWQCPEVPAESGDAGIPVVHR